MKDQKQILLAAAVALIVGLIGYVVYLQNQISTLRDRPAPSAALAHPPVVAAKPAAPAAAPVVNPRVLTAEQKAKLIEKLGGPNSSASNPVWFATAPNNPEAVAFQKQLQGAFEEAGWKVRGSVPARFPVKPGLFVFAADEQSPNYVQSAVSALDDAGFSVTSATGYRDFFKAKKAENPNWVGFDLADDQTYVLVVGRKPDESAP